MYVVDYKGYKGTRSRINPWVIEVQGSILLDAAFAVENNCCREQPNALEKIYGAADYSSKRRSRQVQPSACICIDLRVHSWILR